MLKMNFSFQETADWLEVITASNVLYSSCDLVFLHFTHFITSLNQHRTLSSFLLSHYPVKNCAYLRREGSASSPLPSKRPIGGNPPPTDLHQQQQHHTCVESRSNLTGYLVIAVFLAPSLLSASVKHKERRV